LRPILAWRWTLAALMAFLIVTVGVMIWLLIVADQAKAGCCAPPRSSMPSAPLSPRAPGRARRRCACSARLAHGAGARYGDKNDTGHDDGGAGQLGASEHHEPLRADLDQM